jgi:hypothetical protein
MRQRLAKKIRREGRRQARLATAEYLTTLKGKGWRARLRVIWRLLWAR